MYFFKLYIIFFWWLVCCAVRGLNDLCVLMRKDIKSKRLIGARFFRGRGESGRPVRYGGMDVKTSLFTHWNTLPTENNRQSRSRNNPIYCDEKP